MFNTKTDKILTIGPVRVHSHVRMRPIQKWLACQSHSLPSRLQTVATQSSERGLSLNQSQTSRSPPSSISLSPPLSALYRVCVKRPWLGGCVDSQVPHQPESVGSAAMMLVTCRARHETCLRAWLGGRDVVALGRVYSSRKEMSVAFAASHQIPQRSSELANTLHLRKGLQDSHHPHARFHADTFYNDFIPPSSGILHRYLAPYYRSRPPTNYSPSHSANFQQTM
jgi:hypothetical protein